VLELLVELLSWNNNEFNPYDDSYYIAHILDAVQIVRGVGVGGRSSKERIGLGMALREEAVRYVLKDGVLPSPRNIVGVAAIGALVHLDCMLCGKGARAAAVEGASGEAEEPTVEVDCAFYERCLSPLNCEAVRAQAVAAIARLCSAGLWYRQSEDAQEAERSVEMGISQGIGLLLDVGGQLSESELVRVAAIEALHGMLVTCLAPPATGSVTGHLTPS
jgi:hypothetical protein